MSAFIDKIRFKYNQTGFALFFFKRKWRRANGDNDSFPITVFSMDKVSVGRYSYGPLKVLTYGPSDSNLKIGQFCSIAKEVAFLLGGEHYYDRITTSPIEKYVFGEEANIKSNGDIVIGDDVWIGYRATILSGVTIGQGAVIAANAIVCKDVPPYAVYAGNKVIKYRFDKETIDKLMRLDYGTLTAEEIRANRDFFTGAMTEEGLDAFLTGRA